MGWVVGALVVGVLIGLGIGLSLDKREVWSERWSNWNDVPEHIKEDFRDSMAGMRDEMNDMFDRFEEDFE